MSGVGGCVAGLPPDLLAVDHLRVYWYNTSEGRLYSVNKETGRSLQTQNLPGVQDIIAYGRHLQPLPGEMVVTLHAIIKVLQLLITLFRLCKILPGEMAFTLLHLMIKFLQCLITL